MIWSVWASDCIPSFHGNMCCTCVPLALSQVTAQLGKTQREKNKPTSSSWSVRAARAQTVVPAKRASECSLHPGPLNVIYRSSSPI